MDGRLEFKWFDTAAFDGIIDGGVFDETTESSYQTGANLDGGNFTDYSSGDTATAGPLRMLCYTTISIASAACQSAQRT